MEAALQRTTIWTLSVLLAGIAISYAVLPWDDHGIFKYGYSRDSTDARFPYLTGNFVDYFETKFGVFPQFMIWEGTNQPAKIALNFRYDRPRKSPIPPWGDTLLFGEVRSHLFWRIESVKDGSITFIPFTDSSSDTCNIVDTEWGYGWSYNGLVDLRNIPFPSDTTAYYLQPVVFKELPIEGEEIFRSTDAWSVIRSKRNTPYDSLAWAYYGDELDWNKDIATALLQSFPTSRAILKRLLDTYAADGNCDSLKWVARQYKDALVPNADPMAVPLEGFNNMHIAGVESSRSFLPANEYINEKLMSVCGDTLLGD
ncbi:hypothetical protein KQI63_08695 [bacterium]|nr:hypothetical protein [bacterium]